MKKALKVVGITLASVVALVIAVAAVLVWAVFTPERLTPVVNKVADDYISCEYNIGSVDLTFFSTFPEFGLRVDGILIVNPKEGAPSDTLLAADKVVARIELMRLLKQGDINIHEVALTNVFLNPYIAADGSTNFDILVLEPDTTEEDSTESFIRSVTIEDMLVSLQTQSLTFVDEPDSLAAHIGESVLSLSAKNTGDILKGVIKASIPDISASFKGTDYASDILFSLNMPYTLDLKMDGLSDIQHLALTTEDASLSLNDFAVALNGAAQIIPDIDVDMRLKTGKWRISEVLALVPEEIFSMPKDIKADGFVELNAHAKGRYDDHTMPLIDAHLVLSDAEGSYASLPYELRDVQAEADAHLDLNNSKRSSVVLHSLSAKTKESAVSASGTVSELLDDMLIDLDLKADVNIPDFGYFFPEGIAAKGNAKADLSVKTKLDDLTNLRLEKGRYTGNIVWNGVDANVDSLLASADKATLAFRIPNARPAQPAADDKHAAKRAAERRKKLSLLDGTLALSDLKVSMADGTTAVLGATDMDFQLGDVLSGDVITAAVGLRSKKAVAHMDMKDSVGHVQPVDATLDAPDITAYVEYDTKDTLKIPTLDCSFTMQGLDAVYDTITLRTASPKGSARISGGRRDKTQPRLAVSLDLNDLNARMGSFADLRSKRFAVKAAAQHTDNKENILLEWQPRLSFDLDKAVAHMSGLEPEIKVPEISFAYSNKRFNIDTARVELGKSDFSLSGEVYNIGPWLEKKDLLTGTLNFVSSHADINELLSYISGMGEEEETGSDADKQSEASSSQQGEATAAQSDPFMVPKGVDFTLNTQIKEADAFGQHLSNLGGRAYIRDGVLIIEEMGFICEAAKLQLTAMYKTPRRNHIFVGFDYHMTDINIAELVDMIPQVDSMLPMLRSFKGAANFHLAAETYTDANYRIKPSTIRGACSLNAKDLTLLDGETFTKIAKILTFNKKTENKIDSISAEIAVYKKQIDIYPFLISCDKWMAAVGGQHNLDMTFNYHLSLLNPLYIGVDVSGSFDDLSIKPAKCRYAKDFKPLFHREVDTRSADIRTMIRKALESNLK